MRSTGYTSDVRRRTALLILFVSLLAVHAAGQTRVTIEVINPSSVDRGPEVVEVAWKELTRAVPQLVIPQIAVRSDEGMIVPWQSVDTDADGAVDQLVFLATAGAKKARKYSVQATDSVGSPFPAATDVRFVLPREDVAWENDKIAFRIYGPALAAEVNNGIDVWTKRVRYPIVAKWYKASEGSTPGRDSYHQDKGEGADFFAVGRTLGSGGSAILDGDSLVQPGVFDSYSIFTSGPIRAQFEVRYKPVLLRGTAVTEVRKVTLDAGSNLNTVEVTYSADREGTTIPFAIGLVKRKAMITGRNEDHRWISGYGPTNDKPENGSLGTGAILTGTEYRRISEDGTHILLVGEVRSGERIVYHTGAGWTRSGDFIDQGSWESYMDASALRAIAPLTVHVGSSVGN